MVTRTREHFATLFEGAPRFLDRLVAAEAVDDAALFAEARRIAHTIPEAEQIELLDAHPRLGAPPGTVSALSYTEQGYHRGAGIAAEGTAGDASPGVPIDVAAELDGLNAAYEARFGFRYCVFVAGRPREALLPGFAAALDADRDAELHRGLDAVIDIAMDRHAKLTAAPVEAST